MSPATPHPDDPAPSGDHEPVTPATPTGPPPGASTPVASAAAPAASAGHTPPPAGHFGPPAAGGATDEAYLSWLYPAGQYQPRQRRRPGRTVAVGLAVVLGTTLLGVPFGLLWAVVSPGVTVVQTEDGPVLTEPQPEQFIAADGLFSLLGLGLGALVAVLAWVILRRYRGPLGMVTVVLGTIGAALLAWQVGRRIGLADYERLLDTAPPGHTFTKPPDLRSGEIDWLFGFLPVIKGSLLLPAFAAAVVYTLLAGWSRYPGLRPTTDATPPLAPPPPLAPGPYPAPASGAPYPPPAPAGQQPAAPLSSESSVPPTPSTAPAPPEPGAAGSSRD